MQFAKIVFPEPGDPLSKKPLFGGSLLTTRNYSSFSIALNISDYIF